MNQTKAALTGKVVAVPTTIWKTEGELDLDANAHNAPFLFERGVSAAVYAAGVGEHDRLSAKQQTELLGAVIEAARSKGTNPCLGSGVGRTVERVRELAPTLADLKIAFAMMMPPPIDDQEKQYSYYCDVMSILTECSIAPVLYARPEHPMSPALLERLFDRFEIAAVKLANNGLLLPYAEMVERLGQDRCAWLCGTAGWWMPAYAAVGGAQGMSSGIVNAFPQKPLALLRKVTDGSFQRDRDYWTMVRIERIRARGKGYAALVIKHLQESVGLKGGMNGDGAQLPAPVKAEVEQLVRDAGWYA